MVQCVAWCPPPPVLEMGCDIATRPPCRRRHVQRKDSLHCRWPSLLADALLGCACLTSRCVVADPPVVPDLISVFEAMADQIEQMNTLLENHQKHFEELQDKYNDQIKQSDDLGSKLDATQRNLRNTRTLLANAEGELQRCQYALKEKDYIISQQKKAENALTHQACVLRSALEKSTQENTSLFSKIAREDKLMADNRSVVSSFQTELAKQVGSLCNTVTTALSEQNENLHCIEKHCSSFLELHNKAIFDVKKKISASRALYMSHFEAVQNVVRLHKASSDACLEEISSMASSNASAIDEFLAAESTQAESIFDELQSTLSVHQGEMALFARDLRQKFSSTIKSTRDISEHADTFLCHLAQQTEYLQSHATEVEENQSRTIAEFQKVFEEQSRSEAERLIADMTNLVHSHLHYQKGLVDGKLDDLRRSVVSNKEFLDSYVSSAESITSAAKRKWQEFYQQAEHESNDCADFSAAKHCRMELLLQKCVSTADRAHEHWKTTRVSLNEKNGENTSSVTAAVRNALENNDQHASEIDSSCVAADHDVTKNSEGTIRDFRIISDQAAQSASSVLDVVKTQETGLENLRQDHSAQAASIEEKTRDTFQQRYTDYEETGSTPRRNEPEIPSKLVIEALRAMPVEALLEEFRENHNPSEEYGKDLKPSLIPRSPLTQLN